MKTDLKRKSRREKDTSSARDLGAKTETEAIDAALNLVVFAAVTCPELGPYGRIII